MIPVRGAEEDTFAELGTINPGSVFLKHLRTGKIKVIPGECNLHGVGDGCLARTCVYHQPAYIGYHYLCISADGLSYCIQLLLNQSM